MRDAKASDCESLNLPGCPGNLFQNGLYAMQLASHSHVVCGRDPGISSIYAHDNEVIECQFIAQATRGFLLNILEQDVSKSNPAAKNGPCFDDETVQPRSWLSKGERSAAIAPAQGF